MAISAAFTFFTALLALGYVQFLARPGFLKLKLDICLVIRIPSSTQL